MKKKLLLSISLLMFLISFGQTKISQDYYNSGENRRKLHDYRGAIADYTKAIELYPNYSKAYYNRGFSKVNLNDCAGAIPDFDRALALNPNSLEAYYNRGIAKIDVKDFKSAIGDFTKSIEIDPDFSSAYYNRAYSKANIHDYSGAIPDYTKAIELYAEYEDAFFCRGIARYSLKDFQGAIDDYSSAIFLKPNFTNAYYSRAIVKMDIKDYEGASFDFTKVIEFNDNFLDAYFNRGNAKLGLNKKNEACKDWTKALELGKKEAQNLLAVHCNENALKLEKKESIATILNDKQNISNTSLLKITPQPENTEIKKVAVSENENISTTQPTELSTKKTDKVKIEINNSIAAYYNRGALKISTKDFKGAIEDYTQAIALDPMYADAFYSRGVAKIYLLDYQAAIFDFNKAIELNSLDARAYCNRGLAKAGLQSFSEAIADYTRSIIIRPTYFEAYYKRGNSKFKMKDKKNACLDWEKAVSLGSVEAGEMIKMNCSGEVAKDVKVDTVSKININKDPLKVEIKEVAVTKPVSVKTETTNTTTANINTNRLVAKTTVQANSNESDLVLATKTDNFISICNQGIIKIGLQDYTGAILDFNKAIELEPDYSAAYYNKGNAMFKMNDMNSACKDWKKAASMGSVEGQGKVFLFL